MHRHPKNWLFYLSHRHSQRHSQALLNKTQIWPAWQPTPLIESYSRCTRRHQSPVSAAVRDPTDVTHERRLRRDASGSEPGNTGAFCLARTKLVERRQYGVADRQAPGAIGNRQTNRAGRDCSPCFHMQGSDDNARNGNSLANIIQMHEFLSANIPAVNWLKPAWAIFIIIED